MIYKPLQNCNNVNSRSLPSLKYIIPAFAGSDSKKQLKSCSLESHLAEC
jgi:hypothetical protein